MFKNYDHFKYYDPIRSDKFNLIKKNEIMSQLFNPFKDLSQPLPPLTPPKEGNRGEQGAAVLFNAVQKSPLGGDLEGSKAEILLEHNIFPRYLSLTIQDIPINAILPLIKSLVLDLLIKEFPCNQQPDKHKKCKKQTACS